MNGRASLRVGRYTVSGELFETGMTAGKGPCGCTAACCLAGVYADVAERDKILAHREIIARYMDETQPSSDRALRINSSARAACRKASAVL